jgi:hypothetical protein
MDYQLISIATVLRDYIDVKEDVGYIDDEHKQLVDIADTIWNVGMDVADLAPDYQVVYYKQSPETWVAVFKDMEALATQVSSHNVHDLVDDYRYLVEEA